MHLPTRNLKMMLSNTRDFLTRRRKRAQAPCFQPPSPPTELPSSVFPSYPDLPLAIESALCLDLSPLANREDSQPLHKPLPKEPRTPSPEPVCKPAEPEPVSEAGPSPVAEPVPSPAKTLVCEPPPSEEKARDYPDFLKINLKKYILKQTIGNGASAKVVLAHDSTNLATPLVAIKIFSKSRFLWDGIPAVRGGDSASRVRDVHSELELLKTAKETQSRFLVTMLDVCQDWKNCYVVMPLYPQSLGNRIDYLAGHDEPMHAWEIMMYSAELLLAIEALHEFNVFHCDIKPDNIMIAEDGHLVLVDFGIAETGSGLLHGSRGTGGYMAPEVLQENFYAAGPADIYAYGIVFFQMLMCPWDIFSEHSNRIAITYDAAENKDRNAKDLFQQLTMSNPNARLPVGRIKRHPFFRPLHSHWDDVQNGSFSMMYQPQSLGPLSGNNHLIPTVPNTGAIEFEGPPVAAL